MPIKAENRHRYPPDWQQVRERILARSQGRCEYVGERMARCVCRQYAVGRWVEADKWRLPQGFDHLQKRVMKWQPVHGNGPCDAAGQGLDWPSMQAWTYANARQFAAELFFAESEEGQKPIVIVLTCAHLDHQPENCADDNLRMFCQRHHLAHDHDHHRASAQATRRARSGNLELFA